MSIYSKEEFRGYQASKKRYFYGLKIHLMVTQDGQPVECCSPLVALVMSMP